MSLQPSGSGDPNDNFSIFSQGRPRQTFQISNNGQPQSLSFQAEKQKPKPKSNLVMNSSSNMTFVSSKPLNKNGPSTNKTSSNNFSISSSQDPKPDKFNHVSPGTGQCMSFAASKPKFNNVSSSSCQFSVTSDELNTKKNYQVSSFEQMSEKFNSGMSFIANKPKSFQCNTVCSSSNGLNFQAEKKKNNNFQISSSSNKGSQSGQGFSFVAEKPSKKTFSVEVCGCACGMSFQGNKPKNNIYQISSSNQVSSQSNQGMSFIASKPKKSNNYQFTECNQVTSSSGQGMSFIANKPKNNQFSEVSNTLNLQGKPVVNANKTKNFVISSSSQDSGLNQGLTFIAKQKKPQFQEVSSSGMSFTSVAKNKSTNNNYKFVPSNQTSTQKGNSISFIAAPKKKQFYSEVCSNGISFAPQKKTFVPTYSKISNNNNIEFISNKPKTQPKYVAESCSTVLSFEANKVQNKPNYSISSSNAISYKTDIKKNKPKYEIVNGQEKSFQFIQNNAAFGKSKQPKQTTQYEIGHQTTSMSFISNQTQQKCKNYEASTVDNMTFGTDEATGANLLDPDFKPSLD